VHNSFQLVDKLSGGHIEQILISLDALHSVTNVPLDLALKNISDR